MSTLRKIEVSCDNCQKPFILVVSEADLSEAHYCPFCGEHAFDVEAEDQ